MSDHYYHCPVCGNQVDEAEFAREVAGSEGAVLAVPQQVLCANCPDRQPMSHTVIHDLGEPSNDAIPAAPVLPPPHFDPSLNDAESEE